MRVCDLRKILYSPVRLISVVHAMQLVADRLDGHGETPDAVIGVRVETRVLRPSLLVILALVLAHVLAEEQKSIRYFQVTTEYDSNHRAGIVLVGCKRALLGSTEAQNIGVRSLIG